jgi:iron complex outermembrane receptor protein
MFSQEKEVKGTVLDSEKLPLVGANVIVSGTKLGVVTDIDGNFAIKIPEGYSSLKVSYIGFIEQTVTVGKSSQITITLLGSNTLDEVVVVGYGTQRRENLTSAIVTVKPKDFNGGSALGVNSLIEGKVTGLTISKSGSDPTKGPSVVLRGPSTINGGDNSPFYIVDGVPGSSLAGIAPQDIESVEVLKDASAAAIYGSRATNGVIIVTTKRPKEGNNYITYNTFVSTQTINKKVDVLNAAELRSGLNDFGLKPNPQDDYNQDTDWQDEITQTGFLQNHLVTFGSGGEKGSFNATIGYVGQEGVVKTSESEQLRGRIRGNTKFFKDKFTVDFSLTASKIEQRLVNYDAFKHAFQYLPISPVYNPDGSFFQFPNLSRQEYQNPLSLLELRDNTMKFTTVTSIANLKYQLTSDLTANSNILTQSARTDESDFVYQDHPSQERPDYDILRRTVENTQTTLELFLNYKKKFNENNKLDVIGGYSWQKSRFGDGFQARAQNAFIDRLGADGLGFASSSTGYNSLAGQPSLGESKLISFYGRGIYELYDKYIFQASIRRDGSTKLGDNNKWGNFPAASFAWKISDENFMKSKVISNLKLRASWGQLGNENGLGTNLSRGVFNLQGFATVTDQNGNLVNTATFTQPYNPNPNLRWETTTTSNLGLDFGLFKNRLTGTVEVYDKNTTDLLFRYSVPVPPNQVDTTVGNGGEISNKGIEIDLTGRIIENDNFKWTSNFNISFNKNEVVHFDSDFNSPPEIRVAAVTGRGLTGDNVQLIRPGEALGTFFLPKHAGIINGVRQYETLGGEIVPNGGKDSKGVVYKPNENLFVAGDAQPDYVFNFTNTFNYKAFSLSFLLKGMVGHDIYNGTRLNLSRYNGVDMQGYNIVNQAVADGAKESTPIASDFFLEDGSFIRLDNLTFAYQLPSFGVLKDATISISGENLFTITNYTGLDPEVNLNATYPGIETIRPIPGNNNVGPVYFSARTITFGLNFNF